jgi:hypothetical protein
MTPPSSPLSSRTTLPAGQTQTSFNSAFVQVGYFVFNPTLVMGFVHRPATDESVPSTEVLYESHHITVEDPNQALYFYLCSHTRPQEVPKL